MELRPGLIVAERFRLIRPLGQGGMGAVWLGQQTALDVPCALKFIHEEAAKSPELRARFEREAKAAAQLRSPHVVQILDHGVWEGAPYIAMELLEGEDLEHRLRVRRALPPRETLAIAVQVGRALSKAHSVGLVHRDLKPANIFITRDEDREIAKVLDFGVAKVSETGVDGSTKTGAVLGTPYYMSPEQARGSKTIDHRSDLWALAVVVYQCLTGRLPFMGEALGDLFVKIIIEPLPVPSQLANVPVGFDAWWARAASRDPGQRFQTAKDFADNLGLALGVTVGAGVEIGSALASPDPRGMAPMGSGTVAMMTPSRPITPYPGGGTPYPAAGTPYPAAGTPYPAAGTPRPGAGTPHPGQVPSGEWQAGPPGPAGMSNTPYPGAPASLMGAAPTPMQQAMSMHAAPTPSRTGLVVGVLVGFIAMGVGVGVLAFRSSAPTAVPAAVGLDAGGATAPTPTASATALPAASATASPPATPPVAEPSPTAVATAAASPAGKGHAPGKPVPGGPARPPGPPKDSLGF